MKKLLSILILSLLLCKIGFTQELIRIPIVVNILEINKEDYKTITTYDKVRKDIDIVNKIWSQADILWSLKQVNFIKPNLKGFEKNYKWAKKRKGSEGERLRKIYLKFLNTDLNQSMEGINIYYLPKMLTIACGVAIYKIKNNNLIYNNNHIQVVIGQDCLGEKDESYKILAHELGHILNLQHNKDEYNLMYANSDGGDELIEGKTKLLKQISTSKLNGKKVQKMFK